MRKKYYILQNFKLKNLQKKVLKFYNLNDYYLYSQFEENKFKSNSFTLNFESNLYFKVILDDLVPKVNKKPSLSIALLY